MQPEGDFCLVFVKKFSASGGIAFQDWEEFAVPPMRNACTVDGTNMLETHVWLNLQCSGHTQSRGTVMVCRSGKRPNHKTVHQVSDIESKEDHTAHFLRSVDQDFQFDNYWTVTLSIDGHPTVFKLDTGASVSVISSSELRLQGQQLQPSKKK